MDVAIGAVALVALLAASFATIHSARASEGARTNAVSQFARHQWAQQISNPENPVLTGLRTVVAGGNSSEVSPYPLSDFNVPSKIVHASLSPFSGRLATILGLVGVLLSMAVVIVNMWRSTARALSSQRINRHTSRRIN